jgi:CRISPR system Cascade subunit CasC
MSSTLYRYATIDIAHLNQNLGSTDAAMRAIQAFIKAFITSMPSGKQNSFANRTLPSAVVVQLRSTQPVSLVNAFEKPIRATNNENELSLTCDALIHQEKMLDEAFGVEPDKTFVICAAPGAEGLSSLATDQKSSNMDAVLNNVNECVKDYFDQSSIDGE